MTICNVCHEAYDGMRQVSECPHYCRTCGQSVREIQRLRAAIQDIITHVPYRVEQDLREALDPEP